MPSITCEGTTSLMTSQLLLHQHHPPTTQGLGWPLLHSPATYNWSKDEDYVFFQSKEILQH